MSETKNQMESLQEKIFDGIESIGIKRELIYKVEERISDIPFMQRMEEMITYMLEIKRMAKSTLYRHGFLWERWESMLNEQKEERPDTVWKEFKRKTVHMEW